MAEQTLPQDFREFLRLLNDADVQYLLVGGYAVGHYGYPRATADIDIWVHPTPDTAAKLVEVFHRFGLQDPNLTPDLFLERGKIVRMGVPPVRIEVLNDIDGVEFDECYEARAVADIDGEKVQIISRKHLLINKRASGRYKDLDDLSNIPEASVAEPPSES